MGTVTVGVATYGDETEWVTHAQRALSSVHAQTHQPDEIIHIHGSCLADARNTIAQQTTTDWLIFLDADDTLTPTYVEAMLNAEGTIRRPACIGIRNGILDLEGGLLPRTDLARQNCIVIGAMIDRELFLRVGGFDPTLPALEDWDLWLKMIDAGATVGDVAAAMYVINVRSDSRNSDAHDNAHRNAYIEIKGRYRHLTKKQRYPYL